MDSLELWIELSIFSLRPAVLPIRCGPSGRSGGRLTGVLFAGWAPTCLAGRPPGSGEQPPGVGGLAASPPPAAPPTGGIQGQDHVHGGILVMLLEV